MGPMGLMNVKLASMAGFHLIAGGCVWVIGDSQPISRSTNRGFKRRREVGLLGEDRRPGVPRRGTWWEGCGGCVPSSDRHMAEVGVPQPRVSSPGPWPIVEPRNPPPAAFDDDQS